MYTYIHIHTGSISLNLVILLLNGTWVNPLDNLSFLRLKELLFSRPWLFLESDLKILSKFLDISSPLRIPICVYIYICI
jgi:hypothetical protein